MRMTLPTYPGYWWDVLEDLLLIAAGICAGAAMAGASVWIGLATVPVMLAWFLTLLADPRR